LLVLSCGTIEGIQGLLIDLGVCVIEIHFSREIEFTVAKAKRQHCHAYVCVWPVSSKTICLWTTTTVNAGIKEHEGAMSEKKREAVHNGLTSWTQLWRTLNMQAESYSSLIVASVVKAYKWSVV